MAFRKSCSQSKQTTQTSTAQYNIYSNKISAHNQSLPNQHQPQTPRSQEDQAIPSKPTVEFPSVGNQQPPETTKKPRQRSKPFTKKRRPTMTKMCHLPCRG